MTDQRGAATASLPPLTARNRQDLPQKSAKAGGCQSTDLPNAHRTSLKDGHVVATASVGQAPPNELARPSESRVREPLTSSRGRIQKALRSQRDGERRASAGGRKPEAAVGAALSAAPLGKYANNSSPVSPEALARRAETKSVRYGLLRRLWEESTLDRVRKCRRVSVVAGGGVGLRLASGKAGYSGLSKCGSVWACPVCAAKIARTRGDDLEKVLAWAVEQGHTVAMVTLTSRHSAGMRLEDCWDATGAGWGRVTSGKAWAGESDTSYQKRLDNWAAKGSRRKRPVQGLGIVQRYGVLGFARALEVTHGENGWHVHLHVVMIFEGQQSAEMVTNAAEDMWPAWEKGLASKGFTALRDHGGLDVRVSTSEVTKGLAKYFTKQLSLEVTNAGSKLGRGKQSRTPFQILADVAAIEWDVDEDTGEMKPSTDDLALWHEWERVSHGRQQLTWSKGLREMAGLAAQELTDEEIAEQELGDEDALVLPPETWIVVRDVQVELLLAAEDGGLRGAIAWLEARGLDWIGKPEQSAREV